MTGRPGLEVRGRKGMGHRPDGAQPRSSEWYTPPGLFAALGLQFDCDPCAPPGGLPWVPATRQISPPEDGLSQRWTGRVWLNPPNGPRLIDWMRRMASHANGIALVFARTETRWWHETVPAAHAVCFIAGRLTFVNAAGQPAAYNSGAPSALIAYDRDSATALRAADLGMTLDLPARPVHRTGLI